MAKTKGALIDNQRMPELFKCDEWLRSPMRRIASLSNATNGFALHCDEWLDLAQKYNYK
jgi:hypothetical protein